MRSVRSILVMALLLSGCANLQQQQARDTLQQTLATFRQEVGSNALLDSIRDKVALVDAREITLPMLSLTTVPTDGEKRALEEWQGMVRAYQLRVNEQFQGVWPWAIPILETSRAASLTLLGRLYGGVITYGQYNQQRLDLVTRTMQTIQAREQELRYQQAQIAAQQTMAVSAALSTYQNFLVQQQLINQQFQPVRVAPFTCTRYGNTTSCY